MQPLTPLDVQAALDALGLHITIQVYDTSTATAQQAADRIGCELGQIVKSLAFIVDDTPIITLVSGDQQADDRKIAALFNVGRKKVKMARPEQCVAIYGYEPGGVPPLGHRTAGLPIYIDDSLRRYEQVFPAGGASNAIFGIALAKLVEITNGTFADVKRE